MAEVDAAASALRSASLKQTVSPTGQGKGGNGWLDIPYGNDSYLTVTSYIFPPSKITWHTLVGIYLLPIVV